MRPCQKTEGRGEMEAKLSRQSESYGGSPLNHYELLMNVTT